MKIIGIYSLKKKKKLKKENTDKASKYQMF